MRYLLIAGLAAAAGAGAWFLWPSEPGAQEVLLKECEAIFLERLKAPSTYRRIEVTQLRTEPATADQYLGLFHDDQKAERQRIYAHPQRGDSFRQTDDRLREDFAAVPHDLLSFFVTYDADNSFGVALRGAFECSAVVPSGKPLPERLTAYVDGRTALSWVQYQISE